MDAKQVSADADRDERLGYVLILEPERLLRWSLVQYLKPWFRVTATDDEEVARRALGEHPVNALVISDESDPRMAERVESLARRRNAQIRVIRTVAQPASSRVVHGGDAVIEKPFDLARLAAILGVQLRHSPQGG